MSMWDELPADWQAQLPPNWAQSETALGLERFLAEETRKGMVVYPPEKERWNAFVATPFDQVQVVVVGQDPYHGPNQAHGLSFSVRHGQSLPPSLLNIFKELREDLQAAPPLHGDLTAWAQQGVLLLNTSLSVRQGAAASHQQKGWEEFTDLMLKAVSDKHEHVAFVLWGSHALKKSALIDQKKHAIFSSAHPSPLSAHRGFFGSKPFSRINTWLMRHGRTPVQWTADMATPSVDSQKEGQPKALPSYEGRWSRSSAQKT